MGILSPVMDYVVGKESTFPAPAEKDKLTKAIERYRQIQRNYPNRADIGEIKFGLADLYVGRNAPGDYKKAMELYNSILLAGGSEYLRARTLIGKAELMVSSGNKEELTDAITLCETASRALKEDLEDFFVSKALIVEADLRMSRDEKGDHRRAAKLFETVANNRQAHWYFRARGFLGRGELILYHQPNKLRDGIRFCEEALKLLADRPADYFTLKAHVIEAEIRIRRGKKEDFKSAEKLCASVAKAKTEYADLVARAKLTLAEISKHPKALKLYHEVMEMEGLDPYIIDKVKAAEQNLKSRK
jgi:tetratricopeptide (TPR) repeat protein